MSKGRKAALKMARDFNPNWIIIMDDDLEIPAFLKRDKDAPALKASDSPTVPAVQPGQEQWQVMEQQRRDRRKAKTDARIAKMKAIKADRDAAKAGKTWNTTKGRWE